MGRDFRVIAIVAGSVVLGAVLGGGCIATAAELEAMTFSPVTAAPWRFSGFPIVAWWGPPGTASRQDFEAYRDAGFTLHATNPEEGFDDALAQVEAVGLKSLVFRQHQGFGLEALKDPAFPKSRDSVVGWIVGDEPAGESEVARAVRSVNVLMQEDPTRWTFFNLLPPHLQQQPSTDAVIDAGVRAGMPLLSYDSYVIMRDGSDRTGVFYTQLDQFRQASLRHGVPFWAFALTIAHDRYRRPSESDLRWQHYSNLAYGAKGLWYFTYWAPMAWKGWASGAIVDARDGSRTELYDWVKALNRAVLDIGDLLLRLRNLDVVHTHPPAGQRRFEPGKFWISDIKARDALVGFFDGPDGAAYALVVNKLHGMGKSARETADTVELTFSDRASEVEAVSWLDGTPGPLASSGSKISLAIGGGTGVLLRARIGEAKRLADE